MLRAVTLPAILLWLTSAMFSQNTSSSDLAPGPDEQPAIDQLRAVVEAIKTCQMPKTPPAFDAEMQAEGFAFIQEPPTNIVWNVELHPSIRGRFIGSIEFSEASYIQLPPDDSYCNKAKMNKSACRQSWAVGMEGHKRQEEHPLRFRYEFDVSPHGLDFLSAFTKTKQEDGELWADGTINSDWCAFHAIGLVPSNPTHNSGTRPESIPQSVWDSAQNGEAASQYLIGLMYSEGNGVPQDYSEAYFWLDLAASADSNPDFRETLMKARDAAAVHLTPEMLLDTQKRARQWFETYSTTSK